MSTITAIIIAACLLPLASLTASETIAQINGNKFLSPLQGQTVSDVRGYVTAKATTGIFVRSSVPDDDSATSESIYLFSRTVGASVAKGDLISFGGNVTEYRSNSDYLYLTEISSPTDVQVISSGHEVMPLVLGSTTTGVIGEKNLSPPTRAYTSLDEGAVFGFPHNRSLISMANPTLQPGRFGMDFWESLSGEYVTVQKPVVLDVPNQFGDTWVVGNWRVTGQNDRGGLTISSGDGNPEAILIAEPVDGTDNPNDSKLGDSLAEISGVVTYAFGQYTIRPDTAIQVIASRMPALPPATKLVQSNGCAGVTVADYNIENLMPNGENLSQKADHIANYLRSPTIVFVEEVQDNSGATDDGVAAANVTLTNLINAIVAAGGTRYAFATVAPIDGTTGGQPGGNIRNAYLYNPSVLQLVNPRSGGPRQATTAKNTTNGPELTYNPGVIMPNSAAFNGSRRPLVAQWSGPFGGNRFFTVNVHGTSKGGSTSLFGDARPPVNQGIVQRDFQARVVAQFTRSILTLSPSSRIIAAGDWNEFQFASPQTDFERLSGLRDIDAVTSLPETERYSHLFGQNAQALDHLYVSPSIAESKGRVKGKGAELAVERVHVNTWVRYGERASDHDPSVARLNLCA